MMERQPTHGHYYDRLCEPDWWRC